MAFFFLKPGECGCTNYNNYKQLWTEQTDVINERGLGVLRRCRPELLDRLRKTRRAKWKWEKLHFQKYV